MKLHLKKVKLWKVSILTTILGVIAGTMLGFFAYEPSIWPLEFNSKDMELFKEDAMGYAFRDDYERRLCEEDRDEQIRNNTCIPYHFRRYEDLFQFSRFEKEKEGDRKGKVSSMYLSEGLNNAINRFIDEHDSMDYTGGYLIKNSKLEEMGVWAYGRSENEYSVVPGGWDKFDHCVRVAKIVGIFGVVLPFLITAIICVAVFVFHASKDLLKGVLQYLKWTFN